VGAGVLLGTAAAALERRSPGWGLVAVSAAALVLGWARSTRERRRTLTGIVW
jgi:hypothetical protein